MGVEDLEDAAIGVADLPAVQMEYEDVARIRLLPIVFCWQRNRIGKQTGKGADKWTSEQCDHRLRSLKLRTFWRSSCFQMAAMPIWPERAVDDHLPSATYFPGRSMVVAAQR